jgi:type IV pilus assembly protein PilA
MPTTINHGPEAERDAGFTLVELLVVMTIVGVLAAIAIPTFLTQRAKAHDSATKADVSNLGREVATYFIGGGGPLVLDYSIPGEVHLTDGAPTGQIARLTVGSIPPTGPDAAYKDLDEPLGWCVSLTDPAGHVGAFRYTQLAGLEQGTCA